MRERVQTLHRYAIQMCPIFVTPLSLYWFWRFALNTFSTRDIS